MAQSRRATTVSLLLTVRADYRHFTDILKMPPMCQEQATVEYLKNMEVMMKIGPRLPCRQEHQTLHLQYFSHLVHLLRWERGIMVSGEKELEASVG